MVVRLAIRAAAGAFFVVMGAVVKGELMCGVMGPV